MLIEIRADNTVHIEGYVNAVERDSNIINVPSVGRCVEQIRAGVFDKALSSGADVSILENHDNSRRLGSISEGNLKLYEDNIGLRASADITDIEIVGKARRGELKGWSFGFICTDSEIEQRAGNVPRRIVKGMSLSEVSLIDGDYKPCYNGTLVEVRSEGNFIEYRAGIDETVEVNTPTESVDTSTDAENAPVDSTTDGETVENRSETPDYSYYDAMLRYLELRYNPYHDDKGRFCSGGGGGGGVMVVPKGQKGKGFYVGASDRDIAEQALANEFDEWIKKRSVYKPSTSDDVSEKIGSAHTINVGKTSITLRDEAGKTKGVLRNIERFSDMSDRDQFELQGKIRKAGGLGEGVKSSDIFRHNGKNYVLNNMYSQKIQRVTGENQGKNSVLNRLENNGFVVVNYDRRAVLSDDETDDPEPV